MGAGAGSVRRRGLAGQLRQRPLRDVHQVTEANQSRQTPPDTSGSDLQTITTMPVPMSNPHTHSTKHQTPRNPAANRIAHASASAQLFDLTFLVIKPCLFSSVLHHVGGLALVAICLKERNPTRIFFVSHRTERGEKIGQTRSHSQVLL